MDRLSRPKSLSIKQEIQCLQRIQNQLSKMNAEELNRTLWWLVAKYKKKPGLARILRKELSDVA